MKKLDKSNTKPEHGSMKKCLTILACITLISLPVHAVDNFTRGFVFDGATGEKTGADLEDLVTQAVFNRNDSGTNRLYDFVTLDLDANDPPRLRVKPYGVSTNSIATNGVDSVNIKDYTISSTDYGSNSIPTAAYGSNSIPTAALTGRADAGTNNVNGCVTYDKLATNVLDVTAVYQVALAAGTNDIPRTNAIRFVSAWAVATTATNSLTTLAGQISTTSDTYQVMGYARAQYGTGHPGAAPDVDQLVFIVPPMYYGQIVVTVTNGAASWASWVLPKK